MNYLQFKEDCTIPNLLLYLFSDIPRKVYADSFYYFVINELSEYHENLKLISEEVFNSFLLEQGEVLIMMKGESTKMRFLNMIKKLSESITRILQCYYRGDLQTSISLLDNLFNKSLQKYLNEPFVNYFRIKVEIPDSLFRMRDFSKDDVRDDCNHVPFDKRYLVGKDRFNYLGIPCLYLADNLDTCDAEIGQLGTGKERMYSVFNAKKNINLFLNFCVPNEEEIRSSSQYEQFCWLLTYPFYLLCLSTMEERINANFREEYIMPQLLFHLLFMRRESFFSIRGISYTSTKAKGTNYVIPARYKTDAPATTGHGDNILDLFDISPAIHYKDNPLHKIVCEIRIK